ncbi:phosphate acetyltransferase [Elusimicrobiota bacterium]
MPPKTKEKSGNKLTITKEEALKYHEFPIPGKIEVVATKPCKTQLDLSLAYTPGVAVPCLEIKANPSDIYKYTAKGNLVAVVSNGTAVLGLGNIGAGAGKPVMEGKGVLFKRFADVDVFDIELDTQNPDEVIKTCQLLEPTFGGINLEDIKAPDCFYIEETLKKTMKIPIFHDDQHGTAIISGAALINALEVVGKDIKKIRVVVSGAGASGIACAEHYINLGVKRENITMCDTKGAIYKGRTAGMNPYKERFAHESKFRTIDDALKGADVFLGLSVANCMSPKMLLSMAKDPIVFAMANPDPEITYSLAMETRKDVIMATGRSDYPNQVNNVLGFPFIFRGALDVHATTINEEMKRAATKALADLAKEDVPDSVRKVYGGEELRFGPTYIIPKPFDPRVLVWEAAAVAEAAMKTGVAQRKVNLDEYKEKLMMRLGLSHEVTRNIVVKAKSKPKKIVFPEGDEDKILRASHQLINDHIATPILLGNEKVIKDKIKKLGMDLNGAEIVDPSNFSKREEYVDAYYKLRQRNGLTRANANTRIRNRTIFASMMLKMGDADALVAGLTQHYPDTIRPALQIVKIQEGVRKVAGLYIVTTKNKTCFFADATVNIDPTDEDLAEIAILAAETAKRFGVEPRVAMLSFSNFGSSNHPNAKKVARATELVKKRVPHLIIDGEMQADTAVVPDIVKETFPFSSLKEGANVLIFPSLEAGNIAYKLMARIGGADVMGPILMGMSKPVHVLQRGAEVSDIVNIAAIAVVEAQDKVSAKVKVSK